jgi:hypothetical protein
MEDLCLGMGLVNVVMVVELRRVVVSVIAASPSRLALDLGPLLAVGLPSHHEVETQLLKSVVLKDPRKSRCRSRPLNQEDHSQPPRSFFDSSYRLPPVLDNALPQTHELRESHRAAMERQQQRAYRVLLERARAGTGGDAGGGSENGGSAGTAASSGVTAEAGVEPGLSMGVDGGSELGRLLSSGEVFREFQRLGPVALVEDDGRAIGHNGEVLDLHFGGDEDEDEHDDDDEDEEEVDEDEEDEDEYEDHEEDEEMAHDHDHDHDEREDALGPTSAPYTVQGVLRSWGLPYSDSEDLARGRAMMNTIGQNGLTIFQPTIVGGNPGMHVVRPTFIPSDQPAGPDSTPAQVEEVDAGRPLHRSKSVKRRKLDPSSKNAYTWIPSSMTHPIPRIPVWHLPEYMRLSNLPIRAFPTSLNRADCAARLLLTPNLSTPPPNVPVEDPLLAVCYVGTGERGDPDASAVRANHPIPPTCGVYYYEVEIGSKGRDGYISIGFCSRWTDLNRLVGWERESWAWHMDDG